MVVQLVERVEDAFDLALATESTHTAGSRLRKPAMG